MHLKNTLHGMQKGTDSIDVYWKKIRTARQQLSAAGLPIEYNHFKSHIRTRPVHVTLVELRDLLLKEESDLDAASKSFPPSIMTTMVAHKGNSPSSPHVAHGDNLASYSTDHGGGHPNWQGVNNSPNWQSNWNRRPNYRGRGGSWHAGGNSGSWTGPPNSGLWHHGGQWNNSSGQWNHGNSGQWNNGHSSPMNNGGQWPNGNSSWSHGSGTNSTQYFVPPNPSPGILSPLPTAPPSCVSSSTRHETCQLCLQFGHTAPNCPHCHNYS
ncbi:unnamed protein product [Prunus armeniaca]|uniref:Uncharacterized protein n=1 Tax=Prunus armeniaca TaxID=36596 RepID=A0A6J5TCR9_PRUAR|nr:unnamed protein product [Prunus armeniaca]